VTEVPILQIQKVKHGLRRYQEATVMTLTLKSAHFLQWDEFPANTVLGNSLAYSQHIYRYRGLYARICEYFVSGHAACFGNCRPTFACKVRRVFRESAVPEARSPRRLPFYSVRQKRWPSRSMKAYRLR